MSKGPYFDSRVNAGKQLAESLVEYKSAKTVVLAVSEGSVVVGAQIAKELKCLMTLLMVKPIKLPDGKTTIGMINDQGKFIYNEAITIGYLEELQSEYSGAIEQSKIAALRDMHTTLGTSQLIKKKYFRNHNVIVVSDGVKYGNLFTSAKKYLHDINITKLIVATPVCSARAIDRLHVMADGISVLRVVPEYFGTNHYYDDNSLPKNEEIIKYLNTNVSRWENNNIDRS